MTCLSPVKMFSMCSVITYNWLKGTFSANFSLRNLLLCYSSVMEVSLSLSLGNPSFNSS